MSSNGRLIIKPTKRRILIQELNSRPEFFPLDPLSAEGVASSEWFLAKRDGEIVGGCGFTMAKSNIDSTPTGIAKIHRTGVLPQFQGQGIKAKMVRVMERAAKKRGAHTMTSYCDVDNLASANSLINSGYKLYEPAYIWATGTWLYFRKTL